MIPMRRVVPVRAAVIEARLAGRCATCDGHITPGQRIEKATGGWSHEDCPADPPDDFEYLEPGDY